MNRPICLVCHFLDCLGFFSSLEHLLCGGICQFSGLLTPRHLRIHCRYVLGYKVNSGQQSCRAKGLRPAGGRVIHLVSASATVHQLQSLITDKLMPHYSSEEFEVQVCV